MPLRSQLFSASKELQACLTSDVAHVVPGARGARVALIQSALVRFRFLSAGDARSEARFYGPRTTAAVLAYKRELKIINRNYQSSADNIVGRMTIASLDHGIFVLDDLVRGRAYQTLCRWALGEDSCLDGTARQDGTFRYLAEHKNHS